MAFNVEKSYTEYNITESTSDFQIGFEFDQSYQIIEGTLDNEALSETGRTLTVVSENAVTVEPAVESGTLLLQRVTNIDQPLHDFGAGALFAPSTLTENFEHILQSQQEVRDNFEHLEGTVVPVVNGLEDALEAAEAAATAANAASVEAQEAKAAAEAAAASVVTIEATRIIDASGDTQQEVNDSQATLNKVLIKTVATVNDMLALTPSTGDTVITESYLEGVGLGGAKYVYSAALSTVDNGITIIKGWVRAGNYNYTGYDVGLYCDATKDGDAAPKLNSLFQSVPQNSTVSLSGTFNIKSAILIQDKDSVVLDATGATFTADSTFTIDRVTGNYFNFNSSYDNPLSTETTSYVYGGISFLGVRYAEVKGLRYTGAKNNVYLESLDMEGFQGGDGGLGFYLCDTIVVSNCTIKSVFSWGIMASNISKAAVYGNYIEDCVHQAGIDISIPSPSDQNVLYVYNNVIRNAGLYGIEVENHANDSARIHISGNRIEDCFAGIACIEGVREAIISGNVINNCRNGIYLTLCDAAENLEVHNNVVEGFYYGIIWQSGTRNLRTFNNTLRGRVLKDTYRKASADQFVWRVVSSTSFTAAFAPTVGNTYYINGVAVTVSTVEATGTYVRNDSSNIELRLVTVTSAVITADMKGEHLQTLIQPTRYAEAGLVSASVTNYNCIHGNNDVRGAQYGVLAQGASTTSGTYSEEFKENFLTDCATANILTTSDGDVSRLFRLNRSIGTVTSNYRSALTGGLVLLQHLDSFRGGASGTNAVYLPALPTRPFYAVRVRLSGVSGITTGSACTLTITAGTAATTFSGTATVVGTEAIVTVYIGYKWITAGGAYPSYSFGVTSSVSNFAYTSSEFVLLTDY